MKRITLTLTQGGGVTRQMPALTVDDLCGWRCRFCGARIASADLLLFRSRQLASHLRCFEDVAPADVWADYAGLEGPVVVAPVDGTYVVCSPGPEVFHVH